MFLAGLPFLLLSSLSFVNARAFNNEREDEGRGGRPKGRKKEKRKRKEETINAWSIRDDSSKRKVNSWWVVSYLSVCFFLFPFLLSSPSLRSLTSIGSARERREEAPPGKHSKEKEGTENKRKDQKEEVFLFYFLFSFSFLLCFWRAFLSSFYLPFLSLTRARDRKEDQGTEFMTPLFLVAVGRTRKEREGR